MTIRSELGGNTVSSIGDNAFIWRRITSVYIPDSVTSIGDEAFRGCSNLTSVTIPERVTSIGQKAFLGCDSLTSVHFSDSVVFIGDHAFKDCDNLTSVSIPNSVALLGANPFHGCGNLERIDVSFDHPALAVIDGVLFSKADHRLVWYPMMKQEANYQIPDGTKVIDDAAFYDCKNLTSVTIPDSVTSIGNEAFELCSNLMSITIPDSVTFIGEAAFNACHSLTSVYIPDSVTTIGANPFSNCRMLNTISVSSDHPTLAVVDGVLFNKAEKRLVCYPLKLDGAKVDEKSYKIPDGTEVIGDYAFWNCFDMSVSFPTSVITIEEYALLDCRGMTYIVERDSYVEQYCKDNYLRYTYVDAQN